MQDLERALEEAVTDVHVRSALATTADMRPQADGLDDTLEAAAVGNDSYWQEEDDEDNETFVEPFSLLENVVDARLVPKRGPSARMWQIIHYQQTELLDVRGLDAKGSAAGLPSQPLMHTRRDGAVVLCLLHSDRGCLVRAGKRYDLDALKTSKRLIHRAGVYAVRLEPEDCVQVLRQEGGYLLRCVPRPSAIPQHLRLRWDRWFGIALAASVVLHSATVMALGILLPEEAPLVVARHSSTPRPPVWIPPELRHHPRPPAPPPRPKTQAERRPSKDNTTQRALPRKQPQRGASRVRRRRARRALGGALLAALKRPAGHGPKRLSLSQMTNLSAVRSPGVSSYRVSGPISRAPGSGVRLSTGGGHVATRGGSSFSPSVGRIVALRHTGRRVRGRPGRPRVVRAAGSPTGYLDRAKILRVINQHMHEVQRCYERELLGGPPITGKLVLDWQIDLEGRVTRVRQHRSSLRSPAVIRCVMQRVRSWRFPRPVGGRVTVRMPFVFRPQGFR